MEKTKTPLVSTLRTARILFWGIFIQASLFALWGMQFFLPPQGTQASRPITPFLVFGGLGVLSFVYGIRFYQNYTKVKSGFLKAADEKKRKETLLLAYAIHLLLLEFVCILGILLSLLTLHTWAIYPFYAAFVVGLYFSFPKADLFKKHFEV